MSPSVEHVMIEARLDLRTFEPDAFDSAGERARADGVRFSTLAREVAQRGDEALRDVYEAHMACRRRQPPTALRTTPIAFERWRCDFADERGELALPDGFVLALAGSRPIGLTAIVRFPEPYTVLSGFTGVLPEESGRDLGLCVKVLALVWAKQQGYRAVATSVLDVNEAMRRVNARLGFVEMSSCIKTFSW